jgi:hypothetical protein
MQQMRKILDGRIDRRAWSTCQSVEMVEKNVWWFWKNF